MALLFGLSQALGILCNSQIYARARHIPAALSCVVALVLLSTACAPVVKNTSQAVSKAQQVVPDTWQNASTVLVDESDLTHWWMQFEDPVLTNLIEQALNSNNDIVVAQGRLRSARASLASARGARLPTAAFGADAVRQEFVKGGTGDTRNYSLNIDTAWEVDLFGKLRNTALVANSDLKMSEVRLYDLHRIITAEVAFNYINLRDAQLRLNVAKANLDIQRENLQIAIWRNSAGNGSALEVEQARTSVAQTRAGIPVLEQSVSIAIHQIDVLMGRSPGSSTALLMTPTPLLPTAPVAIDVTLPAALLLRRPDVLSAQHSLAAEVIRIGVVQADLYPAIRLNGSLDTSSSTVAGLFDTSMASLIGGVTAPIFQGGQIRARIEQQKGAADAALASYREAILRALQDVENALVAVRSSREHEKALIQAEKAALASLHLAEIRYKSGAIDFQVLLDTQRSLLSVQNNRVSASASRVTAAVQLFKALGGGWNTSRNL